MIDSRLKTILLDLHIGSDEFFDFMEGKVKSYRFGVQDFPWGCFPRLDKENRLVSINVIVPTPVDEGTICVNIHEYTHAFEMFQKLGALYIEDVNRSEELARAKEEEYLSHVKQQESGYQKIKV